MSNEHRHDSESTDPGGRRGEFLSARIMVTAVLVLLVVVGGTFVVIGLLV
ncbi:hypothetical protein GCM10023340_18040 [Nocardioides marinquilinus]|uniref:Uncharacterized protein n=1 Tax=Nocardioides marinquilinus TaxID=1210400 RepID=A0ABP9PHM5_9ACTN